MTPHYGVVRTLDVQDEEYVLVHLHATRQDAEAEASQLQLRVAGPSPRFSVISLDEPRPGLLSGPV